jgi:hypothetical protein
MESPFELVKRYREIMVELHQLLTRTSDLLNRTESDKAFLIMHEVQKRIDHFSKHPFMRLQQSKMRNPLEEFLRIDALVRTLSLAVNFRLANVLHALRADYLSSEESPRAAASMPVIRGISITGVGTIRVQYVQAVPCL